MNAVAAVQGSGLPPLTAMSETWRERARARWHALRPDVEDGIALTRGGRELGIPLRMLRRWPARCRADGLPGLALAGRPGRGGAKLAPDLLALIEGPVLRRPAPTCAAVRGRPPGSREEAVGGRRHADDSGRAAAATGRFSGAARRGR